MLYVLYEMVVYVELYYGYSGEGLFYGVGGKSGIVIIELLVNGGYKVNMIFFILVIGYGVGGVGGFYFLLFNY